MQDRYDRPIAVGDIVLARPLDSDKQHVIGTISKFDITGEGQVCCLSTGELGLGARVDCYRFYPHECELILTKDGKLASYREVV